MTAGAYGYSGNMERLIAAQNAGQASDNVMLEFAKMQKKVRRASSPLRFPSPPRSDAWLLLPFSQNFEINPRHPLIERLLEKVEEAGTDEDVQEELNESVAVLW